jgi:hypothetical protein
VKVVAWFSAGVSSAIATKLALAQYPDLEIVYIDIEDQHRDSLRFVADCEKWFERKITILKSPYRNVENVIRQFKYINGPQGARCTMILKKRVRQEWEMVNRPTHYVWGMDSSKRERERAERLVEGMKNYIHIFPLIENNISKEQAHKMLSDYGIRRPITYDLGLPNNNCIPCVKGGMGYWQKIKELFPEKFNRMVELEELVGASCMKTPLKDLKPGQGRKLKRIDVDDCGIFCELNL